jgi:hypothetical protein
MGIKSLPFQRQFLLDLDFHPGTDRVNGKRNGRIHCYPSDEKSKIQRYSAIKEVCLSHFSP